MQWADAGLLDFLEYLLEWSRSHPLFVLVLARPELADRRPTWGAGKRSFTSLYLEPLSAAGDGRAADRARARACPTTSATQILPRAEGVPLYAVETVRMLLDRGLLVAGGQRLPARPGAIETLEVPETLHALDRGPARRPDADERRLVQDGSVLGKTFTKLGLGSAHRPAPTTSSSRCSRRWCARRSSRSRPTRARPSAASTPSCRTSSSRSPTRRSRRRSARRSTWRPRSFLSSVWGAEEDEIVEVVAAHYLDAYRAGARRPRTPTRSGTTARDMLVRAGERAASLGANAEAQRAFERAVELTDDPLRPGRAARARRDDGVGRGPAGRRAAHFERSIELFEAAGATHPAARVSARLAEMMWDRDGSSRGSQSMDARSRSSREDEPDEDLAVLAAQLGRFMFFAGQTERALSESRRRSSSPRRWRCPRSSRRR